MRSSRRRTLPGALACLLLLGGCLATNAPPPGAATPSAPDLFRDRAEAALAAEDHAAAARDFAEVLRRTPDDPGARLGLAEAHLGLGATAESEREFAALAADPAFRARALQGQAIAMIRLGRSAAAEPLLRQATALDPELWRAWNALGRIQDDAGAVAEAQDAYERALALRPLEPAIHNNLGVSRLKSGDPAAAERHFLRALELAPRLAVAAANLRLALAFQGRYDAALVGVGQDRLPEALNNVGYVALLRGDRAAAETLFLNAMETSPSFFQPAWRNLQFLGTVGGAVAEPPAAAP
jgi:Flp pilus assembly protein TadD